MPHRLLHPINPVHPVSIHRDGHHVVPSILQFAPFTSIKVELSRLFAAEAKAEETIVAKKPNGADDTTGRFTLGVAIAKFDDQIVAVSDGLLNDLSHCRSLAEVYFRYIYHRGVGDTLGPRHRKFTKFKKNWAYGVGKGLPNASS